MPDTITRLPGPLFVTQRCLQSAQSNKLNLRLFQVALIRPKIVSVRSGGAFRSARSRFDTKQDTLFTQKPIYIQCFRFDKAMPFVGTADASDVSYHCCVVR